MLLILLILHVGPINVDKKWSNFNSPKKQKK